MTQLHYSFRWESRLRLCLERRELGGLKNDAGGGCTEGQQTQKCYISKKQNVRQKKVCKVECGKLFITGVLYGPQELYSHLAQELKALAERHGERLLHTPHNPISLGEK